jgi:hypothetical protein
MKAKIYFIFLFIIFNYSAAQKIITPLESSNYSVLSSYIQISSFLEELCSNSKMMKMDYLAVSAEKRKIPYLKISSSHFDKNKNKIKVMIFAQQHGDEPSGKEGLLMILRDFAQNKLDGILENIDLIIIPQVNPDGAERNRRYCSTLIDILKDSLKYPPEERSKLKNRYVDLNRDHLILTSPETQGLHNLFHEYMPEVVLDIHEYSPYSEAWMKNGYRKDFDEQFGCNTNLNISEEIRKYSKNIFFPFIKKYLNDNGFSFNEYIVGSPEKDDIIRHSTVDIDDGRQGFGIFNTFSFILEGKDGKDSIDNIKNRSLGQYTAIKGFLEFVNNNKKIIGSMVKKGRAYLTNAKENDEVILRMEHYKAEEDKIFNMISMKTGRDTSISFKNYHPLVKPVLSIKKPSGYLVPGNDTMLVCFLNKHKIEYKNKIPFGKYSIMEYKIETRDTITLEDMQRFDFKMKNIVKTDRVNLSDYYFVPIAQPASNLLVLAFEPNSMLGLVHYRDYYYLSYGVQSYPILRVQLKNE